ncbi:MAG: tripartite tricarboxylate transporter substrate binding protein, partial [Desulfatiglandaceae bacterium]
VTYGAGGGTDVIYRAATSVIHQYWGQPLIVVNKPGAGGTVGTSFASKAKPDGYTLLAALQGPLIINPLQIKVDYNFEDFEPLVQLVSAPQLMVANINSPWKNAKEMIEYARANPGKVKLGTTGFGNLPHLMTLRLQELAKAKFTIIPFKGNAPARKEVLGGHIDGLISVMQDASYVKAGALKGLAVLAKERFPGLDVPAFAEQGYPDMVADVWWGVAALKDTPEPIKAKIVKTFEKVAKDKSFISMMKKMEMPIVYLGPRDFKEKCANLQAFFPGFVESMGLLRK